MDFDIIRLNNNIVSSIPIDIIYSFTKDQISGTDILQLDNIKIQGEIFKNSMGNIELDCNVEGVMVLPCAITLKPVEHLFSINIDDEIESLFGEMGEKQINFKNTIDIFPIIWENILMEVPTRVVSEDAKNIDMCGDGWSFTTNEEKTNPLSELMNYIDDSEVK